LHSFGTKNDFRISRAHDRGRETIAPPFGESTSTSPRGPTGQVLDDVTLDPGAKIMGRFWHMIFFFARIHAQAAADALVHVKTHQPFVFIRIVTVGRAGGGEHLLHGRLGRPRRRGAQETGQRTGHRAEHPSSGKIKFHGTSFGWWGT
jgi:hypothetical protein